jgi:hypothetical protein
MRKRFVINTLKWNVDCTSHLVNLHRREGGIMNRLVIRSVFSAVLLLALLSLPSIASADSILWTLTGPTSAACPTGCVTFSDGTTASGSFMFNGTTFTSIDITTSVGTYMTISPVFTSSITTLWLGSTASDLTGTPLLALLFNGPLENTGGTVTDSLTTGDMAGGEGSCNDSTCSDPGEDRSITGGGATSTVGVPEPSALSLLSVALAALLAGIAIRKAAQA